MHRARGSLEGPVPAMLASLKKKKKKQLTDKETYSLKVLDKTQVLKLKGHGLL